MNLEEARAAVVGRLQSSIDYQQSKAALDSAQKELAMAREEGTPERRAEASILWMNAQNRYQSVVQRAWEKDVEVRKSEGELNSCLKALEGFKKDRLASAMPTTKPVKRNTQQAPKQLAIGMTLAQARAALGSHSGWRHRGARPGNVEIYEVTVVDWVPVIFLGNAWMEVDRLIVLIQGGSVVSFTSIGE
jgi:hypothetical protein